MGTLKVPVTARDHIRGAADAPVILVGYADFQCPYSAQAYLSLKALAREAGDMLAIVFRHFPHATTHPFAELAVPRRYPGPPADRQNRQFSATPQPSAARVPLTGRSATLPRQL